uniref:ArfGAP with RhoGAP domain, ankyrin repeat and PH domain 3 n=1 Tax=Xiphophorus couchianus TaxID=32473 RepID=A0A3B5M7J1_9TELE
MATLDGSSAVETFLASIHLDRYLDTFRRAGLLLARDCVHLDHDALVSLGVAATGHRKRILRLTSQATPTDGRRPRQVGRTRPGRSLSLSDAAGSVPPVPPRLSRGPAASLTPPPSSAERQPLSSLPGLPGGLDGTRISGSSGSPGGGSMEMVSNEIYWGTNPSSAAPSGGRSYCSQQAAPPTPPRNPDRNQNLDRNRWVSRIHACYMRVLVRSDTDVGRDAPGFSAVGEAPPPLHCSSFPPEADDDLTISPYASYASLTERAPPIISGCLDKLSPQGNYVFQKRFVKFDGKNLMYFGSEKDVYPKGVIPLAAIQMARPAKDNKFEIVTSHRIFVFRTENETLRRRWVATLQEHVRDHQVFGRRRFGPGSHCQKHGALELKGTKSRVYAAINTDQIWLHKSEQCFRNGIGITVIEARGATIRDGKHRSFDLITPYKTFSFTAESDRDKRDWMEALQEAIAETLSDYEVAEKIWSNRSNRTCADCKAQNPDWASINLCVVICKNCAGRPTVNPDQQSCFPFRTSSEAFPVGPLQGDHPEPSSGQPDHSGRSHQPSLQVRVFTIISSFGGREQFSVLTHLVFIRVQKCADLNQMCTKNLSLLFAPSLFQTDGKGEHEVKIVEDLIDNYLDVFEVDRPAGEPEGNPVVLI